MPPDEPEDKKVKELIAEATRAELERWFGLPSFTELAEQDKTAEPEPDDPGIVAVRERRAKAIAAVDPALVEAIHIRTEVAPETLLELDLEVDVHVDPDLALFDYGMVERASIIGEPREYEIPEALRDDLKECVPQALLRDLHRPETDFYKALEMIDIAAEQRMDIVAEVAAAMRTSWALPPLGASPFVENRELLAEVRREREQPWPALFASMTLANRKVEE
jgi:hypothetical protein